MGCTSLRAWYFILHKRNFTCVFVYDKYSFLRVRPYLCACLVPLQAYYEKQVLYNLQNIQLGPSYDAYPYDIYKRILFRFTYYTFICSMDGVGGLRNDVPRKILGGL